MKEKFENFIWTLLICAYGYLIYIFASLLC